MLVELPERSEIIVPPCTGEYAGLINKLTDAVLDKVYSQAKPVDIDALYEKYNDYISGDWFAVGPTADPMKFSDFIKQELTQEG